MTKQDLPPPHDFTFPHISGPTSYCDVDGNDVFFTGDDPVGDRDLYLAVAQSTLLNFLEIFTVMTAIIYPDAPPGGPYTPTPPSLNRVIEQAKCDASVLKCGAPIEEAFAIWQRSCSGLRLLASHDPNPTSRQAMLDAVAASEARMDAAIQKYEERKA
jgi:hypothetical protein